MKSFLNMLPIIVMAAAFLTADDGALAQDFSPPIVTVPAQSVDALRSHFGFMALRTAKMPADNVDLDSMLLTGKYAALAQRLRSVATSDEVERDINWEDAKIYNGGGFFVSLAYVYDAWRVGNAQNDDIGEIRKGRAALAFMYALDLVRIDGTKCADPSAPGHRADQLIFANAPVLKYLRGQSQASRFNTASISLALEKATADLRVPDKFLCSGGLAQMSDSIRAQGDEPLPTIAMPGYVGKTVLVPEDPAFKPQFVDESVWRVKQLDARDKAPAFLTSFLQGPVGATYTPPELEPDICPTPYPKIAMRLREEGRAVAAISIGADHQISECRIVQGSGSPRLDQATCRRLRCAAKAALLTGEPWQPGQQSKTVVWNLKYQSP
jgi:TonB family protein